MGFDVPKKLRNEALKLEKTCTVLYTSIHKSRTFYMVPSSGRLPPPPHGMVQVGVQGQGRGMPLQPNH